MSYMFIEGGDTREITFQTEADINPLTAEQRNVLKLYAQDLGGNKVIAQKSGKGLQTVKNHITSIVKRLGIDTKGDANRAALRMLRVSVEKGILAPEDIFPDGYTTRKALLEREMQVLQGILFAERREDIAEKLSVTEQVVRNDLTLIYEKLGVHSQIGAFGIALNAKLSGIDLTVDPEPGENLKKHALAAPARRSQESPSQTENFIFSPQTPEEVEQAFGFLLRGGKVIIGYNQGIRVGANISPESTKDVRVFAGYETASIELAHSAALYEDKTIYHVINASQVQKQFNQRLGGNIFKIFVLDDIQKFPDEAKMLVRRLFELKKMSIPEALQAKLQ